MSTQQLMVLAIICGVLLVFCAVPIIIAAIRRHPDLGMIAKLSPLALISFALWFALIVWAASDKRDDSIVSRYIEKIRERNLGPWIVGVLVLIGLGGAALTLLDAPAIATGIE